MIRLPRRKLRFLIAFGPTQEPIDPVRFISNYSTGTMGLYLVQAAKKNGHRVTSLECPGKIKTAVELEKSLLKSLPGHHVLIMAAAVCDVRPEKISANKIKKDKLSSILLTKNPDILAGLAKKKKKGQIFIGFGLESSGLLKNGRKKLKSKNLELIVLQKVTKKETPFGEKNIHAYVLEKSGKIEEFRSVSKRDLARFLIGKAEKLASGNYT